MGASELREWMAFYQMEPWGPGRDNIHAGIIASVIANVFGGKAKWQDFMLTSQEDHRKAKSQGFLAWLKAVAVKKS
jgi:hypothetical protein